MKKKITYTEVAVEGPMADYSLVCGTKAYRTSHNCTIIVSSNEGGRWHLSIAHPLRDPNWNEIKDARYRFVPNDIHMIMALPPKQYYVNTHPHSFHLWELQEMKLRSIIENG